MDTGLSDDKTCYYRLRAYNEASDSDYSGAVSATRDEDDADDVIVHHPGGTLIFGGLFLMMVLISDWLFMVIFFDL